MSRLKLTLGAVLVIGASWGCAYNPPVVGVEGSPADLEQLAGEWQGEYAAGPSGRRGNVWFKLVAGEDHAHGDVLMIPEGSDRAYQPYRYEDVRAGEHVFERAARALTIRFVRAAGGTVSGTLDPYWDPDRRCQVSTIFRGSVAAGTVEGTFSSVCEAGVGYMTGGGRSLGKGDGDARRPLFNCRARWARPLPDAGAGDRLHPPC